MPEHVLTVLPCYAPDFRLALLTLKAIEQTRRLPGSIWIGWTGLGEPPAELQGPGRHVEVFPELLSWSSISVAVGRGLAFALREGYGAVIKADADSCPLRAGWDVRLVEALQDRGPAMLGHLRVHVPDPDFTAAAALTWVGWMKTYRTALAGATPDGREALLPPAVYAACTSGGCYVLSREALQALAADLGFTVPEAERLLPEDFLWGQRLLHAGGRLVDAGTVYAPECAGCPEVSVIHPVKRWQAMEFFCRHSADAAPAGPLVLSGLSARAVRAPAPLAVGASPTAELPQPCASRGLAPPAASHCAPVVPGGPVHA